MAEVGKVVEVFPDTVKVSLKRTEACAKCRVCTAGFSTEEMFIMAQNRCEATLHDDVEIDLESRFFFKALFIMYVIPFVALLSGFFLGTFLSPYHLFGLPSEILTFFTGILVMLLAYFLIRLRYQQQTHHEVLPVAVKVVS